MNRTASLTTIQAIVNKEILSFREALVYLDISRSTLYKLTGSNQIPCYRPGNKPRFIYFKKDELDRYLMSNYNGWQPPLQTPQVV